MRALGPDVRLEIAVVPAAHASRITSPNVSDIDCKTQTRDNAGDACGSDLPAGIAAMKRFLRACTAKPLSAEEWNSALCWNMVVPAQVRQALFAREIDGDDVLSRLSVPVLVTHGRADAIVLPSMVEHVLGVCRTARASWYDDVGHMPFVEAPDRFDRELRALAGA